MIRNVGEPALSARFDAYAAGLIVVLGEATRALIAGMVASALAEQLRAREVLLKGKLRRGENLIERTHPDQHRYTSLR